MISEHNIPIAIVDTMAKSRPTYLHPGIKPLATNWPDGQVGSGGKLRGE